MVIVTWGDVTCARRSFRAYLAGRKKAGVVKLPGGGRFFLLPTAGDPRLVRGESIIGLVRAGVGGSGSGSGDGAGLGTAAATVRLVLPGTVCCGTLNSPCFCFCFCFCLCFCQSANGKSEELLSVTLTPTL